MAAPSIGVRRSSQVTVIAVVLGLVGACGFSGAASGPRDGGGPSAVVGDASADGLVGSDGGDISVAPTDGAAADDAATSEDVEAGPGFVCPAACTSCSGTTCNIDCNGACPSPIVCPLGLPCRVRCLSADACKMRSVSCALAASCNVVCSAHDACVSTSVDCGAGKCRVECGPQEQSCVSVSIGALAAQSLCLQCRGTGGNPGCVSMDTAKPLLPGACTTSCAGGGCNSLGNGFNGCTEVATCP